MVSGSQIPAPMTKAGLAALRRPRRQPPSTPGPGSRAPSEPWSVPPCSGGAAAPAAACSHQRAAHNGAHLPRCIGIRTTWLSHQWYFSEYATSPAHLACRLQQCVHGVQVHDQGALPPDPGPPHAQPQLRAATQLADCKVAQATARTPQALRRYPGSSQSDSGKEGSL
jgi:hypothetical protein